MVIFDYKRQNERIEILKFQLLFCSQIWPSHIYSVLNWSEWRINEA